MQENIYLEVSKSNGAILSYFLERPDTPMSNCNYVEATRGELTYLNNLQDSGLPSGKVANISHLQGFRERLQAAKTAEAPTPTRAIQKQPPAPSQSASSTAKEAAKASLIAAMRKRHNHK